MTLERIIRKRITRQARSQEQHGSVNLGGNDAYQQFERRDLYLDLSFFNFDRDRTKILLLFSVTATEKVPVNPNNFRARTSVGVGVLARSQSGSLLVEALSRESTNMNLSHDKPHLITELFLSGCNKADENSGLGRSLTCESEEMYRLWDCDKKKVEVCRLR